jgi:PAS domain S-box-containing protein
VSRILIADDNEQNLYLLQTLLTSKGHEVTKATNGAEALEKARRDPPEMLVTDVLMPVMDGFTLCRHWKADERLQHIPVVFHTASYTDLKDEQLARRLGAARTIIKPVAPIALVDALEEVLAERERGKPVAAADPIRDETVYLREYNQALIRQLEGKMEQLEQANRALEAQVTEYRRSQDALRESERRFRSLVGNIPGVVCRRAGDEHATVKYISTAIGTLTGFSASDFVGNRVRSFTSIIHPDDRPMVREQIMAAVGRKRPYVIEYRVVRADGSVRWMSERGQAAFAVDDAVAHLDSVILDVTEQRHVEDELARHRERLEELVEERTAELEAAQQELVRKERLAALGQLTATVSHEMRNPLGTIRNSFYVIRRDLLARKPEFKRALDRVDRNIARCDTIIEELLDYTRTTPPMLTQTNVDQWLVGVLDEQGIPDEIVLTQALTAGRKVRLDPERFRRCVVNVLNNACQAVQETGASDGLIRVETEIHGDRLLLRIADSGPGIASDDLKRVFEPLFSTKSFGVGLGLPIVKQIMEQHGGGVDIESTLGQGATVTLWLPLRGG